MSHAQILDPHRADCSPSLLSPIPIFAPPVAPAPAPVSISLVPQNLHACTAPVTLFADFFILLCYLRAHDIQAHGQRFISPGSLSQINQHLLSPDPQPKKRWQKERATQRIRLLHFLGEALGLIAPTSGWIKPTPPAYHWLQQSPAYQRQQILDVLATQPTFAQLWHIYHLPGWHLAQGGFSFAELVAHIQRGTTEWINLKSLRSLIPVRVLRTDPNAQPAALVRGLAQILDELGLIDWHGVTHIRFRTQARPPVLPTLHLQLPGATQPRQLASGDCEDVGSQQRFWPNLYSLSAYAYLTPLQIGETNQSVNPAPAKPQICFQIDPARCQYALAQGVSPKQIQSCISDALGQPIPYALVRKLHAWQRQTKQLTLSRVLLLESDDPDLISSLTQQRSIRPCLARTLSPRAVTVPEDQWPTLLRRLAWRDITPTIQPTVGLLGQPSKSPHPGKSAATSFDQPTLAHLYLSARLCHVLPDVLPMPYRLPFAVLADLEKQLSTHDLALAQDIIDRCLADLARQQPKPPAEDIDEDSSIQNDDSWPSASPADAQHLALIETAITNSTALALTYYSPHHDGLTDRIIEPLRIEQSGPRTYIIAYCQHAQAQRTFRLDRIRALRE